MAEPITFYQQWAAAWQQIDKYSTNPWCVDSKNLDIFSDSQCVKAMPWSRKNEVTDEWIDTDKKERFYLAADWRVWDSVEDVWYNHSYFDENANTINYDNWQWYNKAVFWTPRRLFVAYDSEDNWKTISILTDRLIYNIYSDWIHIQRWNFFGKRQWEACTTSWWWSTSATSVITDQTWASTNKHYVEYSNTASQIYFTPWGFHSAPDKTESCMRMKVKYWCRGSQFSSISIESWSTKLYWNRVNKVFEDYWVDVKTLNISWETISSDSEKEYEFYYDNLRDEWNYYYSQSWIYFHGTCESPNAWVDVRYYKKEDWQYLYPKERNIIDIEDETYIEVDSTEYEQYTYYALEDEDWNTYYQLTQTNTIDFPDDTNIVAFARWYDYTYIFANKWDLGLIYYATDVNLATFDAGYRYVWTRFINAIMAWNYVYVLAEKRGIRGLYIFSQWDMKLLVWADKRYTEWDSLINGKEIYNFNWIMCNWRDHIVCATNDSVFMWWANKLWQNVWAFILKVDWEITDINTKRWYLDVFYTKDNVNYRQTIQDDVNIVNYESEFSVTYPIQINSHYIEKEPLNLMVSHMLPNIVTTIKAYISVNDNYFWSFLTDWEIEPDVWARFRMNWCWWDYWLTFVEKNWNRLTFTISGDLPYQINNTKELISEGTETTIEYSDFSHFKFIWEITKESPKEVDWKSVLLRLTQKNDLPTVRKAQVKLVWTTDWYTTPEIYDIRLLSNQFDK